MTTSKRRFLTACAASVLLAVALSACGGGGGDGPATDSDAMMSESEPERALANVIDLVANESRRDSSGERVSGWWRRDHNVGAQQAVVSGTYSEGRYVNAIISHDDDDQLQHLIAVIPLDPLQRDPWARLGRYISTYESADEITGVSRSTSTIPQSDHGLEPAWQVTELTADYDDGGTLSFFIATDAQPSDGSMDPYETATENTHTIMLSGAPDIPGDEDFMTVLIRDGESIEGSLDGTAGSYSCANSDGCWFGITTTTGNHFVGPGVTFTPTDGRALSVPPRTLGSVPNADYMAFGYWLYVPDDVTDSDNYEFGMFASGGDPFETANLAGLTGTAIYAGDAVGKYYVDGLTDNPTTGSFTADVTLQADFGDSSRTGFIDGEVTNFDYEGDVASSLPATVTLSSDAYSYLFTSFDVPQGSTNIFATPWLNNDAPWPGGHIGAEALGNADGEDWNGEWHAVFYGNGASPTDHPTGVAGTFNVSPFDDFNRVGRGLAGSFSAHRQ